MSRLFESLRIGELLLDNCILIAPMRQYSAQDGCASDWRMFHFSHLAAAKRGAQVEAPKQYWRSQPAGMKKLFATEAKRTRPGGENMNRKKAQTVRI